jgi:hypothetical protein
MSRKRACLLPVWFVLSLIGFATISTAVSQSFDGDEFVNEILEEEKKHYGDRDDLFQRDEDVFKEKQRQAQAEEDFRKTQSERIRQEREALFQKELAKMNQEQQKKAKAQKKKDAAFVNSVLKAYQRGDLYGVLGLHYIEVQLPARQVNLGLVKVKVPGFNLFHISDKAIKKAYRNKSRLVHPDRNRDGRADQAFIALEECSSILLDQKQRTLYDSELRASRRKQCSEISSLIQTSVGGVVTTGRQVFGFVRGVLGPFALPVAILGCLIV